MNLPKNKETTKSRLIAAVGESIAESGFAKLGVNAIARKAGVDKVLIYRYFGGLDALVKAYAESADFWPTTEECLGDVDARSALSQQHFAEVISTVFAKYSQALRRRPLTLEILAWETVERNSVTESLEQAREEFAMELASEMQKLTLPDADWPMIVTTLSCAIHYLAIRARKISTFNGLTLNDEKTWQRFEQATFQLLSGLQTNK